jgi:hypothetical protein
MIAPCTVQSVVEREAIMTRTIADLAPGESAYASPAALIVAPDRSCRIRTDAPICRAPNADATMHVTLTAAGYVADITSCTYQWTPRTWADCPPYAPVVHVIFGDEFLQ